ncbi:MAG: acetyl-CoA hydrolase [Syntrophomonadaceae bacterium]|nr:acetyl-CoA hydrolase [Syntrophomonadaceae bacterium]
METRWQQIYKSKIRTPEEAAAQIKDGDGIGFSLANGQPVAFSNALGKRILAGELKDVMVFAGLGLAPTMLNHPDAADKFLFDCPYLGPVERHFSKQGLYTYTPVKLGDADLIARRNLRPGQVMAMTVSPMDRNGFFSCGINVDYGYGLAREHPGLECLILEVNEHMPRTHGVNLFHVSEVDIIIEHNSPLKTLPPIPITPEDEMIAHHIVEYIPDGACLQLGIGGIPNAVGEFLKDKKDLGVHTEMITDSMLELWECGALTCRRKNYIPHKWVSSFALGSQKLYDFCHDNPMIDFYSVGFVNRASIIGKNDRMVSVNATLEVDLTGQCASESIGSVQYTGTGGQLDFVQGAWLSRGGKSFIALHSTFTDKAGVKHSKIVPMLAQGTFVTTPRTEVDWIVTEYGAVQLKGRNVRQRTEMLISIAHPDFRDELRSQAKKMLLI